MAKSFIRGLLDDPEDPQLPQYNAQGGWDTAANFGRMAAGMTTPGAVADAAGLLGWPSIRQNVSGGNYLDAALQGVGVLPVVGGVAKGLLGAGALYKAAKMSAPEIKAALDPSITRVFYGVDPAKDLKAAKALDMHSQNRPHNEIWAETQRIVGPNGDTVAAETNDFGAGLTQDAIDRLQSNGIASGKAEELFKPTEVFDAVPKTKETDVVLRYDPRFSTDQGYIWGKYGQGGFAHTKDNKIDIQSDKLQAPTWNPNEGDLTRMLLHEFGHIAQDTTGLTGGPKGGQKYFVQPKPFTLGLLEPYISEYKRTGLLSPMPGDLAREMRQHVDPFNNYSSKDAIQEMADTMPKNELNMYRQAYGFSKGGYAKPGYDPYSSYYRSWGEALSRLGEMRMNLPEAGRQMISPKSSFSSTNYNQPAYHSLYEIPRELVY